MNAKGDANRSVRSTKRTLNTAMLTLLAQKPVREITVRELTTLAGVSRGTFYFHYTDIYELLSVLESEYLTALQRVLDDVLESLDREQTPPAMLAVFAFLDENDLLCRALLGPNGDPVFVRRFKELLEQQAAGFLPRPVHRTARRDYLISFLVNGWVGIVERWLQSGKNEPPEQMADLAWTVVRAVRGIAPEEVQNN